MHSLSMWTINLSLSTSTSRNQDTVSIAGQSIDNGIVAREILDEVSIGKLPLFDIVGGGWGKGVPTKRIMNFVWLIQSYV